MIRFILETSVHDDISHASYKSIHTIDIDVPQLQNKLDVGGYGEHGHHICQLIGVEILKNIEE